MITTEERRDRKWAPAAPLPGQEKGCSKKKTIIKLNFNAKAKGSVDAETLSTGIDRCPTRQGTRVAVAT